MIKCKNIGALTCVSKQGTPKSRWKTDKEVIEKAKFLNNKYPSTDTKLVGYKCGHCGFYHLTTVSKKKR